MATSDDATPATKADIKLLMDSIGKLYDANEKWKNEAIGETKRMKDEIKSHTDLGIELLRADLLDAKKDRIENHEGRLRKLEQHTGLVVA